VAAQVKAVLISVRVKAWRGSGQGQGLHYCDFLLENISLENNFGAQKIKKELAEILEVSSHYDCINIKFTFPIIGKNY
jgi:hypothetical protein